MSTKSPSARSAIKPRFRPLPIGPRGGIQLLLIQSVDHLGHQGDVVEVKPGFAYNYLIPQGLATMASDHHKRMVEKHKAKLQQIERVRDGRKELVEALVYEGVPVADLALREAVHDEAPQGEVVATEIPKVQALPGEEHREQGKYRGHGREHRRQHDMSIVGATRRIGIGHAERGPW